MFIPDYLFVIYILCAVLVWYIAPYSARRILLLISSLGLFCAFTGYLPVLPLALTVGCYMAAVAADEKLLGVKSPWQWAGIGICLLPLVAMRLIGSETMSDPLMFFAVGFYSLTGIAYLADVGRGKLSAERNFLTLALYMNVFPKLFLGPVSDSISGLERLRLPPEYEGDRVFAGAARFFVGVVKITVHVPFLNGLISPWISGSAGQWQGLLCFMLLYPAFYLRLSGYTDLFIGGGTALGLGLKDYFDAPLLSCTVWELLRRFCAPIADFLGSYVARPVTVLLHKSDYARLFGGAAALLALLLWIGPGFDTLAAVAVLGLSLGLDNLISPMLTARTFGLPNILRWLIRQLRRGGTYLAASIISLFLVVPDLSRALGLIKQLFLPSAWIAPGVTPEQLFALIPMLILLAFGELYRYRRGRGFEYAAEGVGGKALLIGCMLILWLYFGSGKGIRASDLLL